MFGYPDFAVAIFEMKDSAVTVTEGTDATFPLCVLLDSQSSNLTIPLSVKLVTQDVTAIGEHFKHGYSNVECKFIHISYLQCPC